MTKAATDHQPVTVYVARVKCFTDGILLKFPNNPRK